jgi:hypothetical protein
LFGRRTQLTSGGLGRGRSRSSLGRGGFGSGGRSRSRSSRSRLLLLAVLEGSLQLALQVVKGAKRCEEEAQSANSREESNPVHPNEPDPAPEG